jgi:hypothetical protein
MMDSYPEYLIKEKAAIPSPSPKRRKRSKGRQTLFTSIKSTNSVLPSLKDLRKSNQSFTNQFQKSFQRIEAMERSHKIKAKDGESQFNFQKELRKSMVLDSESINPMSVLHSKASPVTKSRNSR